MPRRLHDSQSIPAQLISVVTTDRNRNSTYLFADVPAPVDATLRGIRIFDLKMPIHMTCLLFFALRSGFKSTAAGGTYVGVRFVQPLN